MLKRSTRTGEVGEKMHLGKGVTQGVCVSRLSAHLESLKILKYLLSIKYVLKFLITFNINRVS